MKKLIFSICILSIGTMSAAEFNQGHSLQWNSQVIENPDEVSVKKSQPEKGFMYSDSQYYGTCLTYGTWYTDGEGDSIFIEADEATLFTMGLPSCTGEGTYLV